MLQYRAWLNIALTFKVLLGIQQLPHLADLTEWDFPFGHMTVHTITYQ